MRERKEMGGEGGRYSKGGREREREGDASEEYTRMAAGHHCGPDEEVRNFPELGEKSYW